MAPKHLSVVSDGSDNAEVYNLSRGPENTAARVRRLQAEARLLAAEQIEALERQMAATAAMADEIAKGGDAYPVGVRALAEQISEDLPLKVQNLRSLAERALKG